MTDSIPILDDDEVAEIETRVAKATEGPWKPHHRISPRGAHKQWHIGNKDGLCQITMGGHERDYNFMAHARKDIPALCNTVRALRYQLDLVEKAFELEGALRLSEVGDLNTLQIIKKLTALQSQLEQVTKELSEEKRLRAELKQIAQIGIAEVSSVGTALGETALTDFRLRAIQLCRDKAAEYEQSAEDFKHDDRLHLCLSSKREAYKAMVDELEQLK